MKDSISVHRRRVLQSLLATAGVARCLGARAAPRPPAHHAHALPWVPGLQLYTLQLKPDDDLAAALHAVRALGYRMVELPSNYGRSAADLHRMLVAADLECPSVHVSPDASPGGWSLQDELAADMHTLGARTVVMPIPLLPARIKDALGHAGHDPVAASALFDSLSADDWQRTAELLNRRAAALGRSGVMVAYHNHGVDFTRLPDGRTGYDILLSQTDPDTVGFELDLGWAVSAGQDLAALFGQLGKRLWMLHLKDAKRVSGHSMSLLPADAGQGMVDWARLAALVRASPVQYMFVEQEPPFDTTPMDAARTDIDYLGKVFGLAHNSGLRR
jgi:sugar phosphate isomerase/epimerase